MKIETQSGRGRTGRDAGLTLLEVTISVAILGIAYALAISGLLTGQKAAGETSARHVATNAVESALGIVVPELRQTGGTTSGSGVAVSASSTGRSGNTDQKITFKTNTGYSVANRSVNWSATSISYWYDVGNGGQIKRQFGSTTPTVLAAGIDNNFAFTIVSDEVTITIQSTKTLSDRSTMTVTGTAKVKLWN